MLILKRTNSEDPDFIDLVKKLDADLAKRDGSDHSFYSQFNKIVKIRHTVIAYLEDAAVGCGAMKQFSPEAMEVKRMYTAPGGRGQGIATAILKNIESWAAELSYNKCVLETGKRQPEAIALYEKNGYRHIANYGQYIGVENSVCFEKKLPTN